MKKKRCETLMHHQGMLHIQLQGRVRRALYREKNAVERSTGARSKHVIIDEVIFPQIGDPKLEMRVTFAVRG